MLKRGLLCALLLAVVGSVSYAGQNGGVEKLGWVSGCWISSDGKETTEEVWMKPAGQSMMGMSRTVAAGKTVFTEQLQIREKDGQTAYIVTLGMGAKPVVFKLASLSDSEVVFENPQHDFPQRIIYRRESADMLFARIEGAEKGVNKAMDFRYKRAKCD